MCWTKCTKERKGGNHDGKRNAISKHPKTIIDSRVSFPIGDFNLDFIPKTGPDIQYQEPSLDIQYQMDRMNFDVRVSGGDIEYIPGSVDFTITQWPDVLIEYIGQPMYVPRDEQFSARA